MTGTAALSAPAGASQRERFGLAFALLIVMVVVLGTWLAHSLYQHTREQALENLGTVSAMKASELEHWIGEQLSHLAQSPSGVLATTFDRWQAGGRRSRADAELIARRLDQFKAVSPEYASLWLFDLDGQLLFSSAGASPHPSIHYPETRRQVLAGGRPVMVDFHMDAVGAGKVAPMLEVLVPLSAGTPGHERLVGLLLYQIDPEPYLFPMLQRWPTGANTAESLLFRVEGDEVVYLSRLRHDPAQPLTLRRPLSHDKLLAAQAARTGATTVEGVDYRGVPSVGFVAHIAPMDWHLLSKIDEAEMLADAKRIAFVVVGAASLLLVVLAWGGWLVLRHLHIRDEAARMAAELARLQATDALHKSEARYQAIVDSQSWELCRWKPDTTLTFVNCAFAAGREIPAEKLVGQRWLDFVPAAEQGEMRAMVEAMTAEPRSQSHEHRHVTPDGRELWMAWTDTPIFDAEGALAEFQSVGLDVTDRKAAELALQVSQQRLALALESANEGLWDWDLPSGQAYLAPTFYTMLGYQPGDFPATFAGWTGLLHPNDLPPLMGVLSGMVSGNGGADADRFELEFRLQARDGSWRWLLGHGMAIAHDDDGLPTRILGINLDITGRRLAEAALRESEERFRAIYDNIQEAIFIHDMDNGAILSVNRRACDLFSMDEGELCAASLQDLSEGVPPYSQADAAYWMMRAASGDAQTFEWHAKDGNGRLFWVEMTMRRARIGEHDRLLAVLRDISQRKAQEVELRQNLERQVQLNRKLEEAHNQLLQSEKMASIGQLAAGVAHELNNPIGFVHSNMGTLEGYVKDLFSLIEAYEAIEATAAPCCAPAIGRLRELRAEMDYDFLKADIAQLVAESKDGLLRVRKIVQDLKDFSRVGEAEWQWADLHRGIDSTLNIVWNELKYKCKVNKEYGQLPEVYCLPSQLNQVFMNLLVNAGHAIETQGEITIRTGANGALVWVEVADTGKGIPKENLNRIFEPFFTTKPVGQGTGLGLSLAYGIVAKHHGRIEVASEVGRGTTFRVVLPVKQELENEAPAPN